MGGGRGLIRKYALPGLKQHTWAYEIMRPGMKVKHVNYLEENECA